LTIYKAGGQSKNLQSRVLGFGGESGKSIEQRSLGVIEKGGGVQTLSNEIRDKSLTRYCIERGREKGHPDGFLEMVRRKKRGQGKGERIGHEHKRETRFVSFQCPSHETVCERPPKPEAVLQEKGEDQ